MKKFSTVSLCGKLLGRSVSTMHLPMWYTKLSYSKMLKFTFLEVRFLVPVPDLDLTKRKRTRSTAPKAWNLYFATDSLQIWSARASERS